MKINIETSHKFTIGLYLTDADAHQMLEVSKGIKNNNRMRLPNGLVLWFYTNEESHSIAILSKGRRVYYGEYNYKALVHELKNIIGGFVMKIINPTQEQLAELRVLYDTTNHTCSCGYVLSFEQFVDMYSLGGESIECEPCYTKYADTSLYI